MEVKINEEEEKEAESAERCVIPELRRLREEERYQFEGYRLNNQNPDNPKCASIGL